MTRLAGLLTSAAAPRNAREAADMLHLASKIVTIQALADT
jgi:hypothetical protein